MTFMTTQSSLIQGSNARRVPGARAESNKMSPSVKILQDHWESQCPSKNNIPCICDIDLMEIYQIASHIVIDDIANDVENYQNRFWGSELTWRFSFEGTNKAVTEYRPANFSKLLIERYQEVAQTKRPHWQKATPINGSLNSYLPVEMVHLPLRGREDPQVCHIISVFDFSSDI